MSNVDPVFFDTRIHDFSGLHDFALGSEFGLKTGTAPTVSALNTPAGSAVYSGSMSLDATVADVDSGDVIHARFEYDRSDNAWTAIGDGTTVATASHSTRTWDISTFTAGINYRVRVRAFDYDGNVSDYTVLGAPFVIGPSLSVLNAEPNTTFYKDDRNTTFYYAQSNTASYDARKN